MVGGDPEVIDRVRPVFDAIGSLTVTMGAFGTGLAAKLARNLVQYGSWLAAYEGQLLAEAAGIDLGKLAQVIKASDARIGGASTLMFRSTVAPFTEQDDRGLVGAMQSAASLAHKDLRAALELARELDVELPLAVMTEEHCDDIFGVGTGTGTVRP
jgi:3-hydroxyisobutyrate dehydrogenase